jgi:hypothetical protein
MTEQQRPDLPTNEEDVEGHRRNFFRADAEGAETSEGTPGQTS